MIRRLRGWPLLLLVLGMSAVGTAIALTLVALLLWVLPDASDASGMSPNATALLLGVLAVPASAVGIACLMIGVMIAGRRRSEETRDE